MTTGDQNDMAWRLGKVLPAKWFPDSAPVLQSVLQGLGAGLSAIYGQISYAGKQTRIATASDGFLDLAALDYLGGSVSRKPGQTDAAFSRVIRAELIRPRATRAGVSRILTDLTGRTPVIFEPANPTDTGGYGDGTLAGSATGFGYAAADGTGGGGGWGSLDLHHQVFINGYRSLTGGVPNVGGYYVVPALNSNSMTLAGMTAGAANTATATKERTWAQGYTAYKHVKVSPSGAGSNILGSFPVTLADALTSMTIVLKVRVYIPSSVNLPGSVFVQPLSGVANPPGTTANSALRDQWQQVSLTLSPSTGVTTTPVFGLVGPTGQTVGSAIYTSDWEVQLTGVAPASAAGGYGSTANPGQAGALEWASLDMSAGQITDADMQAAVARTLPAGGVAWMAITD